MHAILADDAREAIGRGLREGLWLGQQYLNHTLGSTAPDDPFALAVYDITGLVISEEEFGNTQYVLDKLTAQRVSICGTDGYERQIESNDPVKYLFQGGNLTRGQITAIKAAELAATGAPDNTVLIARHLKWPGACASFGAQLVTFIMPDGSELELVIVGSGYAAKYDLAIARMAFGPIYLKLVDAGVISDKSVVSATFVLGRVGRWQYSQTA